jgi:dipeptidyl aminopeptidase/acylaminoacyl peptidase
MPEAPTDAEEKARKERNDARVLDENFKMNHIWVIPLAKDAQGKREPRQITRGDFHVQGFDWSPDGKSIAFSHVRTPRVDDWPTADLSTVDVASGERKSLAATVSAESDPRYSPDGRWIAYSATRDKPTWGQDQVVRVIAAVGGAPRTLADTPDNQANLVGWSADGKKLYFTETARTAGRLYTLPVDGGAPVALDAGDGVIAGANLNHARTHFGLVWSKSDRAPEAYSSAVDRFAPAQISRANEELSKLPMGRTEVVKWKSKDGWEIEGLLTYPAGYASGRRVPLLLVIHGGPAGVFTQSYLGGRGAYPVASFAANGYAVLRVNPRGSSGYGAKFRHANYKDWGGMDYQDLMTGVDHVIGMGVADADRLGVMGWSYGGFMTSWVITQTKRFKAASIGAPVTNLMSFTGTTDIPSFVPDYFGAEFWENPEIYQKHSAMFNIKGAATPSLIQHGEQDERVHIAQGMELYNALRRQGVPARMVTYPRMPHGVTEPRLQLDVMKRNVEWFAQYIKP